MSGVRHVGHQGNSLSSGTYIYCHSEILTIITTMILVNGCSKSSERWQLNENNPHRSHHENLSDPANVARGQAGRDLEASWFSCISSQVSKTSDEKEAVF